MGRELTVLLQGQTVGVLKHSTRGRIAFAYNEAWRSAADSFPLSLSMPLAAAGHDPDVVEPFLWNLLPDNETVLARWGQQFGVSARNIFELLKHVGEDLAGAVQIVRPERVADIGGEGPQEVDWITEAEVGERLRILREDAAAWRLPRDAGQFSLAGAQPKTALLQRDGRWGIPRGRTPTTHILKPPTGEWRALAENEHFCLRLVKRLGLPVATSRVQRFEDEIAIVVERFDRLVLGQRIVRVHQEDLCQSLGVHPANKYENEGGPGVQEIVDLLETQSSSPDEDVDAFLDALVVNWLIGGTDAHAKNFSILLGGGGKARLAPLYDIASRMAYDPWHPYEFRLAMRIGNEYVLGRILPRHWEAMARRVGRSVTGIWRRLLVITEAMPGAVRETHEELKEHGLEDEVVDRLAERAAARARREAEGLRQALQQAHDVGEARVPRRE